WGSRFRGRCCIRPIGSSGESTAGNRHVSDTTGPDEHERVEEVGMSICAVRAAVVLTTITLVVLLALPGGAAALQVGDRAPDFKLAATPGGESRISGFRRKQMVLIEFYHADWGPT